jgi:hypothetical protein
LETAKRLNNEAQGRREAAHPGIGSKTVAYAEGVTQSIMGFTLFNPFEVTVSFWLRTQGAPVDKLGATLGHGV